MLPRLLLRLDAALILAAAAAAALGVLEPLHALYKDAHLSPLASSTPCRPARFVCVWLGGVLAWCSLFLLSLSLSRHVTPLAQLVAGGTASAATGAPLLFLAFESYGGGAWWWALGGFAVLMMLHFGLAARHLFLLSGLPERGDGARLLVAPLLLPAGECSTVARTAGPAAHGARLVVAAAGPEGHGGQSAAAAAASTAIEAIECADREAAEARARRGFGTLTLLRIAWPHRWWLYAGCGALLLRLPLSLSVPHWVAETIGALSEGDHASATRCIALLCAMGTGDALGDFWCIYLFGVAQQRIIRGLRLRLFGAIVRQDIGFFDTTPSGEIASRLTADCAEMANDLTWVFRFTIEAVVRLGSILLYMFVRSWRLGLLAIAIVPATALINRSYARFMHRNQQQVQAALADANAIAIEVIGAIRTVCSFAGERREQARYQAKVEKFYSLIVRQTAVQGVYYMVCNTFLINTCVQAALLAYGCFLVERGLLSHTVLLAFMLYQGQLQEYAQNLLNSFTSLLKSSGAAAKVFDYIERRPRYRRPDKGGGGRGGGEPAAPWKLGHGAGGGGESTENGDACGLVELRDVFFCYPSRPEAAVLRGLSLTVLPGQTVALVGQSGSGKSTVLHLLKHFYEATSGCVRIDGRDVCDMPHAELHAVAASVSQEPVLLSGTIEDNIRYALSARAAWEEAEGGGGGGSGGGGSSNDDEAALRERLVAAATAANAHGFISGLRDGYQTAVGERGVQLSGGQRQRIAIARSLLLDPAVLLLDEATSALDAESEAAVQEALERAMQGRTTLVIAHRLSTVRHADCIVLMHGGAAVEAGTHDELIARPLPAGGAPSYRQLVKLQTAAGGGDT